MPVDLQLSAASFGYRSSSSDHRKNVVDSSKFENRPAYNSAYLAVNLQTQRVQVPNIQLLGLRIIVTIA